MCLDKDSQNSDMQDSVYSVKIGLIAISDEWPDPDICPGINLLCRTIRNVVTIIDYISYRLLTRFLNTMCFPIEELVSHDLSSNTIVMGFISHELVKWMVHGRSLK